MSCSRYIGFDSYSGGDFKRYRCEVTEECCIGMESDITDMLDRESA